MATRLNGPSNRLWTSFQVMSRPTTWAETWRARYGDPFLVPSLNGDVVVTGRPDLIQKIFTLPTEVGGPFATDLVEPIVGMGSVMLKTGAAHKRDRKLLMPPFHGDRMRAYGETIREVTSRALAEIPVGRTFTMLELGQRIALEIIVRVVFGVDDDGVRASFMRQLPKMMEGGGALFLFVKALQHPAFPPWARYVREIDAVRALLQAQIEARRARAGDDVLSLLLAARDEEGAPMADDEIIDQLRTLLIAGHETTAISLSWAMHDLLHDARIQASVDDELTAEDTVERWAQSTYLRALCDETLRLHPIVPDVMRTLREDIELDGKTIAKGLTLDASVVLAHQNEDLYVAPQEFRPERFVGKTFSPFEYLPFGGGARRCIGAAFALYEMRIVLATLLSEGAFALVEDRRAETVRRSLTLAPKGGVKLCRVTKASRHRAAA